jgi:hypothetical protein
MEKSTQRGASPTIIIASKSRTIKQEDIPRRLKAKYRQKGTDNLGNTKTYQRILKYIFTK